MYKDTGCESAFDFHSKCLSANLGSIVDSLIDFENFVDFQFDEEACSVINRTLHLYLDYSFECVAVCQNLFSQLLADVKEISNET